MYAWVTPKGMPGLKVGRFWKFKREDVDAWVRAGGAASSSDDLDDDRDARMLSKKSGDRVAATSGDRQAADEV